MIKVIVSMQFLLYLEMFEVMGVELNLTKGVGIEKVQN